MGFRDAGSEPGSRDDGSGCEHPELYSAVAARVGGELVSLYERDGVRFAVVAEPGPRDGRREVLYRVRSTAFPPDVDDVRLDYLGDVRTTGETGDDAG